MLLEEIKKEEEHKDEQEKAIEDAHKAWKEKEENQGKKTWFEEHIDTGGDPVWESYRRYEEDYNVLEKLGLIETMK